MNESILLARMKEVKHTRFSNAFRFMREYLAAICLPVIASR